MPLLPEFVSSFHELSGLSYHSYTTFCFTVHASNSFLLIIMLFQPWSQLVMGVVFGEMNYLDEYIKKIYSPDLFSSKFSLDGTGNSSSH